MKKAFLILGILIFAFYTMYSTGYFRKIENTFVGTIEKKVKISGVEDMQICYDNEFIILSSDDRAGRRDGNTKQGHLYYINLNDTSFIPIKLTANFKMPFYPHGISIIKTSENKYNVFVINHVKGKHSIELFDLQRDSIVVLNHVKTFKNTLMLSPNDLVAVDDDKFYFTNDHGYTKGIGKIAEEYLNWSSANVIYYDGEKYKEVARNIGYANGIRYDEKRKLLYVAELRKFRLKVYNAKDKVNLDFIENIDCKSGIDNIEISEDGKLWIGAHPSLLTFSAYAKNKRKNAPSEVLRIDYKNKGDYNVESIFLDDGSNMSGSSVATSYKNYIFVGNVMDNHFLILKK